MYIRIKHWDWQEHGESRNIHLLFEVCVFNLCTSFSYKWSSSSKPPTTSWKMLSRSFDVCSSSSLCSSDERALSPIIRSLRLRNQWSIIKSTTRIPYDAIMIWTLAWPASWLECGDSSPACSVMWEMFLREVVVMLFEAGFRHGRVGMKRKMIKYVYFHVRDSIFHCLNT